MIPEPLRTLLKPSYDRSVDGKTEYLHLGPIPEGTPIGLLANVDGEADPKDLLALGVKVKIALAKIKLQNLDAAAAKEILRTEVAPALWTVSKCRDLVEDRGHEFGSELPDADKLALIEFLKTL